MTKYIYIDESGDLGLRQSKSSTRHFVIAVVLIVDEATRIELEAVLARFKRDANIPLDREIKFHSLSDQHKTELLLRIKKLSIEYFAFIIDKQKFARERSITRPIDLHQELLAMVFMSLKKKLKSAIVMIDRSIDARLVKVMRTVIHRVIDPKTKIKVVFARSKNQLGLQVADLIAGSVLRTFEKKDDRFFKIIKSKTKLYP